MSPMNRSKFLSHALALVLGCGSSVARAQAPAKSQAKSQANLETKPEAKSTAPSESKPASDCVTNFENGQRLRKEGKLRAAAEALISCSQPECPAFIAKECTSLYSEAQGSLPSVTVRATDGSGQLLTDVSVYVDDVLLQKTLDGRAVTLDPGVHEFRFEAAGKPSVTSKVLVAEGEKNKVVAADFATTPEPGATSAQAPVTEPPAPAAKAGPPIAAYVVGGLGLAAIGGGIAFRLIADKDYRHYETTCSPNCKSSDIDALDTKYTLSYVGFGIGGAALVTSGILFLVHGNSSPNPQSAGLMLTPLHQGGMLAGYSGRF